MEAERVAVALETRLAEFMLTVEFTVGDELLALVGPAGAGKSIVLRSVAGVYAPDAGRVAIGGRVVFQSSIGVSTPPGERRIGYVPQNFALFPHLTVADNVAFPLRRARPDVVSDMPRRVAEVLELLELGPVRNATPGELSDIERWRVALGRALITDPDVLLLDDAFAALDRAARQQARVELAHLRRGIHIPALVATGDLDEAREIADRIGLLDGGKLLQLTQPAELLARPVNRRVAQLIGSSNVIPGVIGAPGQAGLVVETPLGLLRVSSAPAGFGPGYAVDLILRPDQARVLGPREQPGLDDNVITGTLVDEFVQNATHALTIMPTAGDVRVHVLLNDLAYQQLGIAARHNLTLAIAPAALHVIARA